MTRSFLPSRWLQFPQPYVCRKCLLKLNEPQPARGGLQNRWITQNHLRKTAEAKQQWDLQAKEIKAGKKQSMLNLLEERGYVHSVVGEREALDKTMTESRVGAYVGIDPTASSLHVGHMLPLMTLAWLYVHGFKASFLLGGATAKIGDPTGRTNARETQHSSVRKANMVSMHMQLKKLGFSIEKYGAKHGYKWEWAWKRELNNNNTWWNKLPMLEVLRDLGQGVRIGPMLGRDTVKNRMAQGEGMSFAEFTYPLMQAWDWWHLYQHGVQIQIGGSDQYGNILAGIDAVKYVAKTHHSPEVRDSIKDFAIPIGFTTPLLTTSSGDKFGKSAGNAIWLDSDMTSHFDLYQFFLRTSDDDVERYLKLFTFVPTSDIRTSMEKHRQDPSKRVAQHMLAREFVELIHGPEASQNAEAEHRQIFKLKSSSRAQSNATATPENGSIGDWNPGGGDKYAPKTNAFKMPSPNATLPRSLVYNQPIHKVLWSAGLVSSRSEAHRLVVNNGASVGSRADHKGNMSDDLAFTPIKTWEGKDTNKFIIDGNLIILRIGKWKLKIVRIISDEEFEDRGLTAPGWKEEEQVKEAGLKDRVRKVAKS